uniref:CHK domain-containing protein n=1 Tax=Steinernema glaseri TaxID=37863 RepID=A0A1I8AF22_9BILA
MRRTKTQPHVTPIAQRCSPRTSNSPPPSAARTLMEPRRIGSTSYDLAFLIDILNEHDELYPKFIKIENVAEKLVSENRGFGSNIYSVRLTSGEGEEYSFVCKIPTVEYLNKYLHEANEESKKFSEKELEEQEEINLTQVRETHNREVDFYRFAKENIPKSVKIPRFIYGEYMTEENECIIIMEDLSDRAHKGPSKGLSKEEAFQMPVDSLIKCLKAFITLSAHDLLENEDYTWFTPELAEKTIALSEYDKLMKVMASRPELGMPPVICQGDLWPSNVLWEHKSDGMRHLLSIIDWQDCYIGSYANDLASLLAINMDAETRKSCEQDVLRYYVEKMNEYKKSFNLDIDLTYDKAWIAYKKAIQVAILITMTIVENPEDVVENGENMGRITKRLVHMLEDAEFE